VRQGLAPHARPEPPVRWFDGNLRDAFVREIEHFVESQLADDRGVTELLTADYTFLNARPALHPTQASRHDVTHTEDLQWP